MVANMAARTQEDLTKLSVAELGQGYDDLSAQIGNMQALINERDRYAAELERRISRAPASPRPRSRSRTSPSEPTAEQVEQAVKLFKEGKSDQEVKEATGITDGRRLRP